MISSSQELLVVVAAAAACNIVTVTSKNKKRKENSPNKESVLWLCAHKSNTLVHELNCCLLLHYKITLPKYNIKSTKSML